MKNANSILSEYRNKRRMLKSIAKDYLEHPERFTRLFSVRINGKYRDLVTYTSDENGNALRTLHEYYAAELSKWYKSAVSSFAYKKGVSYIDCINQHMHGQVFFKTDIHSYFNSITADNLIKKLETITKFQKSRAFFTLITKACFYQERLPLGFVSSPVISDFYLSDFDKKYQKNKKVVYTRYADDFIVSSSNPDNMVELEKIRNGMEKDLAGLDLQLNCKKTYFRQLNVPGDAIHVLGVNIVKTVSETNRITISDSYIRKVCMEFGDWVHTEFPEENEDRGFLESVLGKIEFVRHVSEKSYGKLIRMIEVKEGYKGSITAQDLCQYKAEKSSK